MTDDHAILIAAALIRANMAAGDGVSEACVNVAREMLLINRKLEPVTTQPSFEPRKATLSHPTIQERNEAHAERQYNKKRGT